ncbi:MAG: hydroxymethylbilane synthase [Desulfobacterales bacterium]|nr:hydroxymethylbilane synthase [Desulfobacterales bacterium]
MMPGTVRIGTRGSKLALWQAEWVKSRLESLHAGLKVELTIIKTKGDKILDVPLAKVGGKGLFVKEIEEALLAGRIDLAVHSMKDMPAEIPAGLCIGAVPEREVPADALIAPEGLTLDTLPRGARIGTSSLRRASQLRRVRPDIEIVPLRGNLDTRLRKLDEGQMEAIVLAAAGVRRLGLEKRISQKLDTEVMLPAVGQGALCIETRDGDTTIAPLVAPLEDAATRIAITAERAYLHRLEGGCQVPIAGHATLHDGQLTLRGLVSDLEGQTVIQATQVGRPEKAETLGRDLAEHLLAQGARAVLDRLQTELPT